MNPNKIKAKSENARYDHVESRKIEGAHYTPEELSDFLATKILRYGKTKKELNIVDPAVGDGELLLSLIKQLKYNSHSPKLNIYGFDTNKKSIEIATNRILKAHPKLKVKMFNLDFLEVCLEKKLDKSSLSIFKDSKVPDFDLLIANPPYVRTQVLGKEVSNSLSKSFGLNGKVDLYQAFMVAMRYVLKPDGVAGVIVSNRFLSNKGAASLRKILLDKYTIQYMCDFGDTKLFEAAVLPAIIVMSPKNNTDFKTEFSSIYQLNNNTCSESDPSCSNPVDALNHVGKVRGNNDINYLVRHGELFFNNPSEVWSLQDEESKIWRNKVKENTWKTFRDIGKIRVGVKTTADKVFIHQDWDEYLGYKPELVQPLTTHHIAGRFAPNDNVKKGILYPHEIVKGKRKAVNLEDYPLSMKYLKQHEKTLKKRKYVIESGRNWFEIWVPQNPDLWVKPKLIFKDISEQPTFWMDFEGTIVNGDCFWMTNDENQPDNILWLVLAVANSKFIEDFYDINFNNKLYSNRRRFITQYVEKFPLPDPSKKESKEAADIAKQLYLKPKDKDRSELENRIDNLVFKVFGV